MSDAAPGIEGLRSAGLPRAPAVIVPADDWLRLHPRTILVDVVRGALGVLPFVVAVTVFGVEMGSGQLWPLAILAVLTVAGAVGDTVRWAFTRYRITPTHVELRTGVLVRAHRSMQRDRIRSVDLEAKLRHRLAGLRVVKVGAGQHAVARESALRLDAVTREDASGLRALLLPRVDEVMTPEPARQVPSIGDRRDEAGDAEPAAAAAAAERDLGPAGTVLARFEPRWFIYNMFSIWAYAMALGLGWGAYWFLQAVGVDVGGFVSDLVDRADLGRAGTGLVALGLVGLFGAVGMAVNYFVEYWNFELSRVAGKNGTLLRTRRGLATTREVDREDARMRGAQITEPVLWRWLGVSETNVITTGLNLWSMSAPASILPRGPVSVARRVAGVVLMAEQNPFLAPLTPHPRAALRRRLWWATWSAGAASVGVVVATIGGHLSPTATAAALVTLWSLSLTCAVVAYRALGYALTPPYVVARSGLLSRATTVLQTSAVSTVVLRESLLQRRLGLRTVSMLTSAGYGGYDLPDLDAQDAVTLAAEVSGGLLDPFLVERPVSAR